jgi:azurin
MKLHPLGSIGVLILSLLLTAGTILFLSRGNAPRTTVSQRETPSRQQGGQAPHNLDKTFLKGGVLQQNLKNAQPEEFLEEYTNEEAPGFTTREFSVHANKIVSVILHNRSVVRQQHNWVLVSPNTGETIQAESRKVGQTWQWIPNSPDILAFVPLTQPGQSNSVVFGAPQKPRDYPFFFTFSGHGKFMKGILHVLPENEQP